MKRSGIADLPLHTGRVPPWLAERMTKLGTAITETIVHDYGTSAFLSRLSDPFWFQAFGAVMGMDWHSSGITTSVLGALKRGLGPRAGELGLHVCGGRGRHPPQLEFLGTLGPDGAAREMQALARGAAPPAAEAPQLTLPHLTMPARHDVRASDVVLRRLRGNLAAAAECGPKDFTELLRVPGVGARTVRALALVAEVVHGAPCRFTDPARFAFAHGGKDRHPFPVPVRVYDETLRVLKSAVRNAKLGRDEELGALKRLDDQARRLEPYASGPSV